MNYALILQNLKNVLISRIIYSILLICCLKHFHVWSHRGSACLTNTEQLYNQAKVRKGRRFLQNSKSSTLLSKMIEECFLTYIDFLSYCIQQSSRILMPWKGTAGLVTCSLNLSYSSCMRPFVMATWRPSCMHSGLVMSHLSTATGQMVTLPERNAKLAVSSFAHLRRFSVTETQMQPSVSSRIVTIPRSCAARSSRWASQPTSAGGLHPLLFSPLPVLIDFLMQGLWCGPNLCAVYWVLPA